jgi:hypothetical protein
VEFLSILTMLTAGREEEVQEFEVQECLGQKCLMAF